MQGRRRMTKAWLIAATLALAACGESAPPAEKPATLPAGETLVLAEVEIPDLKAVGAEIGTRDRAAALVRIPGTLVSLSVRAGDTGRQGQRIGMVGDARIGPANRRAPGRE